MTCLAVALALLVIGTASSQDAPLEEIPAELFVDSGEVVADDGGPPEKPQLVYSDVVAVPGAGWIRLQFELAALSGSLNAGNASFVRLTSLRDGAAQQLDAASMQLWQHRSAYFNGNAVMIELFAYPGTGINRLIVGGGWFGLDDGGGDAAASICGGTDDRVPSSDPAVARIIPAGCTGFLINNRQHCFLTAGHCTTVSQGGPFSPTRMQVVEFNVPLSTLSGQIVFAHPDDQYPVDTSSIQFEDTGLPGGDWCYFGAFDNSNTGLSPLQAQGTSYTTAQAMPAIDNSPLRITGHGIDLDPPGATGLRNQWSQTQQTHVGTYDALTADFIPYDDVDTMGGNSGSPMIKENIAEVIGIHTHGGCDQPQFNINHGQRLDDPALQNALANPQGICASLGAVTVHVPADYPTIQAAINIVGNGSEIIVAPGIYPEHINFLGKIIHLHSSGGPGVTTIDGQGALGTVVICSGGETPATILEGFTITGGNGGGLGGGMHISNDSSPTVENCTFFNNTASWGGGVRLTTTLSTVSTFTNCRFFENSADRGGGMHKGGSGVVHLVDCEFDANSATDRAGALHLTGGAAPYLTATNCSFTNNVADSIGGAVFNGGGSNTQDTRFMNCHFEGNSTSSATSGGAMYISTSGSGTTLIDCVFLDNASGGGGAIARFESIPSSTTTIIGCEFRNNTAAIDGGAVNSWGNVNSIPQIGTSLFCENTPNDIIGTWTDQGGNQFLATCPANPPPLNDDCPGAVPIAAGDTAIDNLNATDSNIPIDPLCGTGAASDVWFSYTTTVSGDLLISTCNQVNFDSWIAAYRGCCGSLTPLGCNGGGNCGQTARLLVKMFEGEEILIRVGGNNGAQGSGTLTLTEIPENCRAGFGGGVIAVTQMLQVLSGWGSCPSPCPPYCLGDFNRDCQINVLDLLHVLSGWGACPSAPEHYQHDAGNNTHATGLTTGGLVIWLQRFDVAGGGTESIGAIQTAFGLPAAPGNAGIAAGDQVGIAVYDDTGNGPADTPIWFGYDTVLGCGIDTGQSETFALPSPLTVSGSFYVAAWVANTNSLHPAPLDSTVSGHGPDVWIAGDPNQTMTWDPATGLSSLQLPPVRLDQVSTPGTWLLRAAGLQ